MEKVALKNGFSNITDGGLYKILDTKGNFYSIIDDSGLRNNYPKNIFKKLSLSKQDKIVLGNEKEFQEILEKEDDLNEQGYN